MAIFDLVSDGAKWITGSNKNGSKSGFPGFIDNIQKFSDSLTYQKCTQFGDDALDFITVGDCKPSILSTLSKYTKNSFANRYITKIKSNIDVMKHDLTNTENNLKEKFQQSYYCTMLAPMFNILINLLEGLIEKPKKILAMIYKYIEKMLDIIKSLVNRLFSCFEAAIQKFKQNLNNLTAPTFLDFMQGVSVWSERCEVIAGPIVSMFNAMVAEPSIKQMLYDVGTIQSPTAPIHFYSIQEVNAFLKVALNLTKGLTEKKNKILEKVYNSQPVQDAVHAYQLMKAYTQYAMAIVIQKILSPLLKLNAYYNNMLHTRSRYLGIVVNALIGWLFPPKGYAHKYDQNIIYRSRYSIVDIMIICDSLNDCNDYLCGGLKQRIQQMFNDLKLNRTCWWMNPLIDANNYMDSVIAGLNQAYSNAFAPTMSTKDELQVYVDIEFIKIVRSFNNSFYTVEGY